MLTTTKISKESNQIGDQELISQVNAFRTELAAKLALYKPNYRPDFFERLNHRYEKLKSPISKRMMAACKVEIVTMTQAVCFIEMFEECRESNLKHDKNSFWDTKLRKRPKGSELGKLFETVRSKYKVNNYVLKQALSDRWFDKNEQSKKEMLILSHMNSMIEEIIFAKFLRGEFPPLQFKVPTQIHASKLKTINSDLFHAYSLLIENLIAQIYVDAESAIINRRKNMIEELTFYAQKNRANQSVIHAVIDSENVKLKDLKPEARVDYLVKQEIIKGFCDSLLSEAKQFFWRWRLHAINSNIEDKNASSKYLLRTKDRFIIDTAEYYGSSPQDILKDHSDCLEIKLKNDSNNNNKNNLNAELNTNKNDKKGEELLQNEALIKALFSLISDMEISQEKITNIFEAHIDENLSNYKRLVQQSCWSTLASHGTSSYGATEVKDCDWISYLKYKLLPDLLDQLANVDHLLQESSKNNNSTENNNHPTWILIEEVKKSLEESDEFEAIKLANPITIDQPSKKASPQP